MVPIVVSELQFFEIKREVLFRDAMVLDKPLLGPQAYRPAKCPQ
jgi:hypothetical protein